MYSWPCASLGSASMESTNCGSKILKKKISESMPHVGNYIHSIYTSLSIIASLEMISV